METAQPRVVLPGARKNLAKSATRALDVLEYFASEQRPLRAVDVAQALGFRASSTDQLLKTMVDSGYLVFDSQRKDYYPTPRLIRFGSWLGRSYHGSDRLAELLIELGARTEDTVTLALRQGVSMQLVDVVRCPGESALVRKGLKVPILGTSLGAAWLSSRGDAELYRVSRQLERTNRRDENVWGRIRHAVDEVRSLGFAVSLTNASHLWAIAIPLPKSQANVDLVLALAGPLQRHRPPNAELATIMRDCVGRILELRELAPDPVRRP